MSFVLVSQFVNKLNQSIRLKKSFISTKPSKFIIKLCILLQREGVISNFFFVDYNKLEVHLRYYQGKPVVSEILLKSKPSLLKYKSYRELKLDKLPTIYSNSFGLGVSHNGIIKTESLKNAKLKEINYSVWFNKDFYLMFSKIPYKWFRFLKNFEKFITTDHYIFLNSRYLSGVLSKMNQRLFLYLFLGGLLDKHSKKFKYLIWKVIKIYKLISSVNDNKIIRLKSQNLSHNFEYQTSPFLKKNLKKNLKRLRAVNKSRKKINFMYILYIYNKILLAKKVPTYHSTGFREGGLEILQLKYN